MPDDPAAFKGIKVKVVDSRKDPVPGATVKFRGKWGNQTQTRGGGTTGTEGMLGLGRPEPDNRAVEIVVSVGRTEVFKDTHAWVEGTPYQFVLSDALADEARKLAVESEKTAATSATRKRTAQQITKLDGGRAEGPPQKAGSKLGWQGKFQAYFAMWPQAITAAAQSELGIAALALLVIGLVAMLYRSQAEWLTAVSVLSLLAAVVIIVLSVIFWKRK
jgi:hypothetical protein